MKSETETRSTRKHQAIVEAARAAFLKQGYDGTSMEEIAAKTDSPVGTVKARMFRARARLREYLPALAGGPDGGLTKEAQYPTADPRGCQDDDQLQQELCGA